MSRALALAMAGFLAASTGKAQRLPVPLPQGDQQWIRVTSANFRIISTAPERRTREIAELLETVSGALRSVHPRFDARFGDTTVLVFNRRRDSQPYFELLLDQKNTRTPGAFVAQADGTATIIIDAERTLTADRTIKHELMHNILSTSGARLPLWLEEGIAEYFSTTVIRGNRVIVGRPISQHQATLRIRGVLPMEEFLEARRGSSVVSHALFYPQAWAIVDWLMRTDRPAFYAFVADLEVGMPVEDAFQRHYAIGAGTVARAIRSLAARPSASSATQFERTSVSLAVSRIEYADALCEIARFLSQMRPTRGDAEQHLEAALEAAPHHPRATAFIGTLRAHERKFDEAARYFEKALSVDPRDPEIKTAYAQALLQNSIGPFAGTIEADGETRQRFLRARELASAALEQQPTPLREAIVGTTYLVEEDVSPAIAHLERARAARPARLDFAINLYTAYLRSNRPEDAESLYTSVFETSRYPQDAQAALAARSLRASELLLRANRHIEAGSLDQAGAMTREAIAMMHDPAAKADLENQLANLERVAESNRQIRSYNDAVGAFNRREHLSAVEILDKLLSAGVDEALREKAEKLLASARRRLAGM